MSSFFVKLKISLTGSFSACFFRVPRIFFHAEDGIRDWSVTGVQTCALPILATKYMTPVIVLSDTYLAHAAEPWRIPEERERSEERRVGKECRYRYSRYDSKQTTCSLGGRRQ